MKLETHPRHPRHLVGSKWTRHPGAEEGRERHWTVQAFAPRKGVVTLEAVLTARQLSLPWRALRERSAWEPGWIRLDEEES